METVVEVEAAATASRLRVIGSGGKDGHSPEGLHGVYIPGARSLQFRGKPDDRS